MVKQIRTGQRVRVSHTLNDGEQEYVAARKKKIHKWLKEQDIDCELDEVPNIALLGSGGGQRAAVGLLGSLMQQIEDDMLDSILYMAGVSGSTWCMASLYKDAGWSMNKRQCEKVAHTLKGPAISFNQAVSWLRKRKDEDKDPDFDLTDFWATFTTANIMEEMDYHLLSEQAHRNATNPYPMYCAIELDMHKHGKKNEMWFELTPHESGFSGLGAYVDTSLFRSQFEAGVLTENRPEVDMILLQGLCGSALADGEMDIKELKKMLLKWIFGSDKSKSSTPKTMCLRSGANGPQKESECMTVKESEEECSCVPSRVIRCMGDLLEFTEDPEALMEAREVTEMITKMGDLLEGHMNSEGAMLWSMDVERWQGINVEEREEFIRTISHELILTSEAWTASWNDQTCTCFEMSCQSTEREMLVFSTAANGTEQSEIKLRSFNPWGSSWSSYHIDLSWVLKNIAPPLSKWKWGTTSNFLYRCQDPGIPSSLASKQKVHLIDSGLMINSPYPPVLRPERKVDLIISLDFSAGDPFETVFLAKEYAKDLDLHFPKVDKRVREDNDYPKDCYIFEGHSEEPTVIHMPLFNRDNCKGKEDLKKMRDTFTTFQGTYSTDMIIQLLEKAQANMRNNRDRILDEIKKVIQRKRNSVLAQPRFAEISHFSAQQSSTARPLMCSLPCEPFPKKVYTADQEPPGNHPMPMGWGTASMQYGPGVTPGLNVWSWGAQQSTQQPAQNDRQSCPMPPPPPGPLPPMPFPGYCLVPMVCPPWFFPAYSATYGPPQVAGYGQSETPTLHS